jgi:hypothetical protein
LIKIKNATHRKLSRFNPLPVKPIAIDGNLSNTSYESKYFQILL